MAKKKVPKKAAPKKKTAAKKTKLKKPTKRPKKLGYPITQLLWLCSNCRLSSDGYECYIQGDTMIADNTPCGYCGCPNFVCDLPGS